MVRMVQAATNYGDLAKVFLPTMGNLKSNRMGQMEEMHAEVNKLKRRLSKMNRGLLNPFSPRMQRWDMVTLTTLLVAM
eukprot:3102693-Prymnesium_polylepis.1